MPIYTVHEAKTNLSKLIERAEAGDEVIIARRDQPAVRLVPVGQSTPKRKFGAYKGDATVTDAFFDPLPDDELDAWDGDSARPNAVNDRAKKVSAKARRRS
jgi:prevent-host-death family protein